jgi:hypothetical protein
MLNCFIGKKGFRNKNRSLEIKAASIHQSLACTFPRYIGTV